MTAYKTPRFIDVYRFEGNDGEGPYRSDSNQRINPLGCPFKHPTPRSDPSFKHLYDKDFHPCDAGHYFAFSGIDQLMRWFDNEAVVNELIRKGYKLYKMTVEAEVPEDVIFGETQVMFIKAKVCRKEELDVLEIYNDCFA